MARVGIVPSAIYQRIWMHSDFLVQDCAIAIAAADLNPAMLNLDILRYSGVIPANWETAKQPVYGPSAAQIAFKNGVNIVAEGRQFVIIEPLEGDIRLHAASDIAQQYIRAFPNLQYKGFTFTLRGYLPTDYPAGQYVCEKWLASGPWQEGCDRAALNLVYKSERAPLQLALTEAMLQTKTEETISIVLFNGRYGYAAKGDTAEEKCRYLSSCFGHLQSDAEHYMNTISTKFVKTVEIAQMAEQPQLALSANH